MADFAADVASSISGRLAVCKTFLVEEVPLEITKVFDNFHDWLIDWFSSKFKFWPKSTPPPFLAIRNQQISLRVSNGNDAASWRAEQSSPSDECFQNEAVHLSGKTATEIVVQVEGVFDSDARARPHLFQPDINSFRHRVCRRPTSPFLGTILTILDHFPVKKRYSAQRSY